MLNHPLIRHTSGMLNVDILSQCTQSSAISSCYKTGSAKCKQKT